MTTRRMISALPNRPQAASPLRLIYDERCRQIAEEGYTIAHDDTHRDGELAIAAACYADRHLPMLPPDKWPFEYGAWKPATNDRVRELVKAGALLVTVFVVPRRGPTPTPEQVEESIVKLLHSDEMHATIDLPDGSFEAASFNVVSAEANAEKLS